MNEDFDDDVTINDQDEPEESIDDVLAKTWADIEDRNKTIDDPLQRDNIANNEEQPIIEATEQDKPERLPNGWKKETAAKFKELPPDIQQEIFRREDENRAGFEKGVEPFRAAYEYVKTFEPIVETIQSLRQEYGNEAEGIKYLHGLSQFAQQDPIEFIKQFAQSRGISLDGTGIEQQQNPMVNTLAQEIQQLKGFVQTQQQQVEQQRNYEALTAIEAFKKQPNAEHFEVLKGDMAVLLQAGLATTLEDAYDRALWQRPDLRESAISQQIKARQEQARKQALEAKNAASVNVKQRGHLPSKERQLPMDEFMQQEAARLGLI